MAACEYISDFQRSLKHCRIFPRIFTSSQRNYWAAAIFSAHTAWPLINSIKFTSSLHTALNTSLTLSGSLRGQRTKGRERGGWMRARSALVGHHASRSRCASCSHSTSPSLPVVRRPRRLTLRSFYKSASTTGCFYPPCRTIVEHFPSQM